MPTLEERFWAKVDKRADDECWPWLAARIKDKAGSIGARIATTITTSACME